MVNSKKIKEIYLCGIEELKKAEIENEKIDARALMEFVLKIDFGTLPLYYNDDINENDEILYKNFIQRRKNHEPLSYITNKKEFYSLPFYVKSGVLVPRTETENLVDFVLKYITQNFQNEKVKIADLCCGSGCIGLSVGKNAENSEVSLFDISDIAIEVSQINKKNIEVPHAQIFLFDIFMNKLEDKYDIIVSNPPYIPINDIPDIMPDVKDYEPQIALTDGKDGLSFYKKIAQIAKESLNSGGIVAVEVGINQYKEVSDIFSKYGKTQIVFDDFGIERIVTLQI